MSWLKPKSVENYTGMEYEQPYAFGNEMPNFDICGAVFKELLKGLGHAVLGNFVLFC